MAGGSDAWDEEWDDANGPRDRRDGRDDELDPRFLTRYDGDFADWRRARLLEEALGAPVARPESETLLPQGSGGLSAQEDSEVGSKVGRRAAERLRQRLVQSGVLGGEERRIDLDAVVAADDLEVHEFPPAKGHFVAALLPHRDGPGGVIFLAPGQTDGRRRFSIAHELGHYHIKAHRVVGPSCECNRGDLAAGITTGVGARGRDKDDVLRDALRQSMEQEANDFAAELLMPAHLVAADVARRDLSMETALQLARAYDVSLTMAAWRAAQTTDEACALVMSSGGVVRWIVPSRNCPALVPVQSARLPVGSAASAVARGEPPRVRPERVPPHSWLERPQEARGPLLESTFRIATRGQILSMLWMPEFRS